MGLVVNKTVCCTKSLPKYIRHNYAAGIYDDYIRKVLTQISYEIPKASNNNFRRSLSITDLREDFIFGLFVFSIFSSTR